MEEGAIWVSQNNLTASDVLDPSPPKLRETKIVCTVGPACADVDTLVAMIDRGMNVARLNFSHGDHAYHAESVRMIREANKKRPQHQVAILLDTKGPEIRTGLLENHEPITLVEGQELELTTDYNFVGNSRKIACSYDKLPQTVHPGSTILIADGTVVCEVTETHHSSVKVTLKNDAKIGEKKNMCIPGKTIDLPTITDKDEDDIINFGVRYGVDFIAASFVRYASDGVQIRDILGPRGQHIKVIAKIENHEGIHNFEEILNEVDGIMVARGDLGMEIPAERVFLAQKMMIKKCKAFGKPVITATQMLESMINNPRPTRAEASDVANAVLDGTDCVMLSGETAGGRYPLEAVEVMAKICVEAERCMDPLAEYDSIRKSITWELDTPEGVCAAAVKTAIDMRLRLIVCITATGNTALNLAKYRPPMPILIISENQSVVNQANVIRGAVTMKVPSYEGQDTLLRYALNEAKNRELVKDGDKVVAVHGRSEADVYRANIMKILVVGEESD